ncbi:MAG: ATP-binding protein [Pseudohongiella sp.]|nr:ATP-binding protein [Pseudohongiella sp.]
MSLSPSPALDSVFPLYLVMDQDGTVRFISDQLAEEIGNACLGQKFAEWFIVKRPILAAHVPEFNLLQRQMFLFITKDGTFAMRGQLLVPAPDDSNITMVITPWLTWMQENRPDRLVSPKSYPVADAQLELQLYLSTQQMMMDDMNGLLLDLQKATNQAIAASSVKSQFVNHISHELRTPLNGILSAAELLKYESASPHARQLIDVIRKSSDALLGIINQILYYSQISSGNLTLAIKQFDPAQLCRDVLQIMSVLARQNNITIEVKIHRLLPASVSADAQRIHNVLLNLVGNAIKHCEGADVVVSVSIRPESLPASPRLLFEVQDSGPGVPPADRDRIFEPFATIAGRKLHGESASGLGLAIVKSEVTVLGGDIGIGDTPSGKGSLFWFDVPVELIHQAQVTIPPEDSAVKLSGRVLVVDDNNINLKLCKLQIERFGLHVDAADSAADAIALATGNQYQLILMDIQMPGMDGKEAAAVVRQLPQYTQTPIIAWTANACEIEAKSYQSSGFNDTLVKPVTTESLRSMLVKWMPGGQR